MDETQMAAALAGPSPATTGQTVAQALDAIRATGISPNDIKAILDFREVQKALATLNAASPTIAAPANAAAIATFVLTTAGTGDYAEAYLTLKRACVGFLASPPTNTWDDVFKALVILPTVVMKATPHLATL